MCMTAVILSSGCSSDTSPVSQKNQVSISGGNVCFRTKPSLEGAKLGLLQNGDSVRVLERTEKKLSVNGQEDYWYKVEQNGKIGWIFGKYLSGVERVQLPKQ